VGLQLGEKAKVRETEKLYNRMWRLPRYRAMIIGMILSVLAASLLLSLFRSASTPGLCLTCALLRYILLLAVPVFVGTELHYLLIRQKGSPLDHRRVTGMVEFGMIFWLSLGVVGGLLALWTGQSSFEARFWILGAGLVYLVSAFLSSALSDHRALRNLTAAMFPPLLWFMMAVLLSYSGQLVLQLPQLWPLSFAATIVLYSAAVLHIYGSVSRPFERDLGVDGPQLLRAFAHSYLADNAQPFDEVIRTIATSQDVPIEVAVFRSNQGLAAVGIVLYVHPGPFRNVGSSILTSAIIDHIESKYAVPAFVMHGSCTHHQNLASKDEFGKVMAEIDQLIDNAPAFDTISGPHWSENSKFKVWTMFVGNDVLTITTSAPDFTDDISIEVGLEAAKAARGRTPKIGGIAVVDAHNCINSQAVSVMPGDPEAAQFIESLSKAVSTTVDRPRERMSLGACRIVPNDVGIKDGVGPGGIVALVIKTTSHETALLSIDGNNMEPGFREQAIALLKTQGFDQAEIVTTDSHIVNAISLSSRGYPPVGRSRGEEILGNVRDAATKARERLTPVRAGLSFGEAKGLMTYGVKGFETLTQDVAEGGHIAKRVGLSSAGVTILLSVLLTFLI